jgi:cytochrome c551/c552
MYWRSVSLLAIALIALTASSSAIRAEKPAQAAPTAALTDQGLVQKYCITCHNDRAKTGGLSLEGIDVANVGAHAELWEKVAQKVRGGMMPPQNMPRPDEATLEGFATRVEKSLDAHAVALADPGHKPVHRLNRTEYGNAVRDLLALEIDNIAGVLRISPSLLEQYLSAARQISSLAVGSDRELVNLTFKLPPDDSQEDHVDGLPLGTRGGVLFRHNFPQDGEYDFSVFLLRNIVGYMTGLEFPHTVEVSVDGERVFAAQVGGEADNLASDTNMSLAAEAIDKRLKARVKVKAGPRMVGVTFVRRNGAESDEPLQLHERNHDLQDMNGLPLIDRVNVTGPFNPTGPGDTPSRRRIFTCVPARAAEEAACARTILSTIARRAYRRPVTAVDLAPVLEQYERGRAGGSFEHGIEQGLRLVLASPKFLFRTESTTPPARGVSAAAGTRPASNGVQRVTDLELASRLSFFLWSSIPDDELLTAASQNRLSQPATLDRQIRRMLKDPQSRALVDNFASQWLMLRNLKGHVPVPGDFPNFDNELRQAFRTETELFFQSIIREDRSVVDLLNADYTYANERLARHYDIPGVVGSHFRRVRLVNDERRGLLGQGSILTVTSYPNRTSPVLRGKWILENILGTPPPPPPPGAMAVLAENEESANQSVRERLEIHRRAPACAGCHRVMDPLGFALENFDGIGEWRVKEVGGAVDPGGQLADGSKVDGPVALRNAILKRPELFVRTFTEKLMTYGLGRGVEYADRANVRMIAAKAAAQNYRFSSIVLGIVSSTPFQMKKAASAPLVASH